MNFFEQSVYAMNPEDESISRDDVQYWSEEVRKMAWMRETRIRTFMQMELETCWDELDWLIRCHNCAATFAQMRSIHLGPYLFLLITSTICRGDWAR